MGFQLEKKLHFLWYRHINGKKSFFRTRRLYHHHAAGMHASMSSGGRETAAAGGSAQQCRAGLCADAGSIAGGSSSAGTLHYSATFTQVPVKHEECPVQKDIMHTSIDGQDSSDNDVDDGQDSSDNDVENTQETSARYYCMASSVLVLQQGVTRDLVQERIRTVIYSNRARHRTVYGTLHIPVRQHRIDSFQTCYICFIILFSSNLLYC